MSDKKKQWRRLTHSGKIVSMRDMKEHLEKLRVQIAECEMVRDLATESKKRELFARLADHFKVLAGEIEKTIEPMPDVFLGRTQEPFSKQEQFPKQK